MRRSTGSPLWDLLDTTLSPRGACFCKISEIDSDQWITLIDLKVKTFSFVSLDLKQNDCFSLCLIDYGVKLFNIPAFHDYIDPVSFFVNVPCFVPM